MWGLAGQILLVWFACGIVITIGIACLIRRDFREQRRIEAETQKLIDAGHVRGSL